MWEKPKNLKTQFLSLPIRFLSFFRFWTKKKPKTLQIRFPKFEKNVKNGKPWNPCFLIFSMWTKAKKSWAQSGSGPGALGLFFVDPCHRMLASGAFAGVTLVNCSLLLSSVVCSMLVYYPRRRSRARCACMHHICACMPAPAHACTYVHACPRLRMHAHMCMQEGQELGF